MKWHLPPYLFKFTGIAIVAITTLILYTNCSNSGSSNQINNADGSNDKPISELIKTDEYELLGKKYPVELYKIRDSKGTHYVAWTPSQNKSKKVIIVSDPYDGVNWTNEPIDLKWASRPNAETGFSAPDEDGPFYQAGVSQNLFYQLRKIQDSVGFGGIFLPNEISVLIVFSRFYAGRGVQDYAQDMVSGIQFLFNKGLTDSNSFGIFGISLGGFVTLQGSLQSPHKPQFAILGSPLLDLKREWNYLDSLNTLVTDSTKKAEYQSFFEPYRRRIKFSANGTPTENDSGYIPYSIEDFKFRINFPTLIMQDTWDTLTPSSFVSTLASANVPNMEFLWYTHQTAIDFNTFVKDHIQPAEGMNNLRMMPFYQLYALKKLSVTSPQVYLDLDELNYSFSYFRGMQVQGQNINWLKAHLERFCEAGLQLIDFSSHHYPTLTGSFYIQQLLKNVWNHDLTETAACQFVKTHELSQY